MLAVAARKVRDEAARKCIKMRRSSGGSVEFRDVRQDKESG
jgi:hypothetical protein